MSLIGLDCAIKVGYIGRYAAMPGDYLNGLPAYVAQPRVRIPDRVRSVVPGETMNEQLSLKLETAAPARCPSPTGEHRAIRCEPYGQHRWWPESAYLPWCAWCGAIMA